MSAEVLENVVLFGADTARSRAYLSLLLEDGLRPAACVLLALPDTPRPPPPATSLFDNETPLAVAARGAGIEVFEVPGSDINAAEAVAALAACPQQLVIFSGPAGALVKAPLFATGKSFLHVHPGRLPQYRGSTTMYYSLLAEEKIWVSALLLDPQIDQGPVVDMMEAEVPADCSQLDQVFDPLLRARLMRRVLARYRATGRLEPMEQTSGEARTYFVIHPVLKHIAIQSRAKAAGNE
jgi:methionyl-tRNA formyltransferase